MKKPLLAAALSLGLCAAGLSPARAETPSSIPSGYRAFALPLSGYELAFVKQGDRVDVMITFDAQLKTSKEKVTATILQDILVLDVQKPEKLDGTGVIDVILNPNEAQYLALSQKQGELSIAVRGPGDTAMKPMEMASLRKLFR